MELSDVILHAGDVEDFLEAVAVEAPTGVQYQFYQVQELDLFRADTNKRIPVNRAHLIQSSANTRHHQHLAMLRVLESSFDRCVALVLVFLNLYALPQMLQKYPVNLLLMQIEFLSGVLFGLERLVNAVFLLIFLCFKFIITYQFVLPINIYSLCRIFLRRNSKFFHNCLRREGRKLAESGFLEAI